MRDYGVSVLEQYDIDVDSTRRVRGAVLCNTNKGLCLLKEMKMTPERTQFLISLYEKMQDNPYFEVDTPLANSEGNYISQAEDGTTYILKKWFDASECDLRRESEVIEGAKVLAHLHKIMHLTPDEEGQSKEIAVEDPLLTEYERHNRELRKIKSFIQKRSVKGIFEREFLRNYEKMYQSALHAYERLKQSSVKSLYENAMKEHTVVHGDYNYHNILFGRNLTAVTEFSRASYQLQLTDLYYYLRKILEKCRYDERIGYKILKAYDSVKPLTEAEQEYLALRLAYPEKFWKTANLYYHSNKAWMPEKNVEKLQVAIEQTDKKREFLSQVFAFHL